MKDLENQVLRFLERDDNSTICAGKRDTKTKHGVKYQQRVLNDYIHNLHEKFCVENPNVKLCRAKFSRMRPAYIKLCSFANRKTCLCCRHQNFTLLLRSINTYGVKCTENPDNFIKDNDDEKVKLLLCDIHDENVTYNQWATVNFEDKKRWKIIKKVEQKDRFVEHFLTTLASFREHVNRVKNQYKQIQTLRGKLQENELLVWMDFAENYNCHTIEDVQSSYWNGDMVTLHTTVVYMPNQTHKSFVAISDDMGHNAVTVIAILNKLIPLLQNLNPNLKQIYYLTDSPTSQYRNKTIFQFLSYHKEQYGIDARWDYLEAGHGKGPCDGLGAAVKRAADDSVKQGKCVIQSPEDFFAWTQGDPKSSTISYFYVNKVDVQECQKHIDNKKDGLQPVTGTLQVHAVVTECENEVWTRNISCYCDECYIDVKNTGCQGWTKHYLKRPVPPINSTRPQGVISEPAFQVRPHDWVSAEYDHKWFIGEVTDTDESDILINFMERSGKIEGRFKWPKHKDEIWREKQSIFWKLSGPPESIGKTKRSFAISDDDLTNIKLAFQNYMKLIRK